MALDYIYNSLEHFIVLIHVVLPCVPFIITSSDQLKPVELHLDSWSRALAERHARRYQPCMVGDLSNEGYGYRDRLGPACTMRSRR